MMVLAGPSHAEDGRYRTLLSLDPGTEADTPLRRSGFTVSTTPGQPALPEREVRLALHPRADLASLRLRVLPGPVDTVPGTFDLEPNPPLRVAMGRRIEEFWGEGRRLAAGRDPEAYGQSPFPRQLVEKLGVENRRGLLVLRLRYRPLRYRHLTRELLLHRAPRIQVSYRLRPGEDPRPDPQLAPHLSGLDNAGEAARLYPCSADAGAEIGYAILVRDALASRSSQLQNFIKHKKSLGFTVYQVGDKDLGAMPIGPSGGDAERMRLWLQKEYKQKNLRFVLIIGNPDPNRTGLPMKVTYALSKYQNGSILTPSDDYYADLTGNWDLDGDGQVAEYFDDNGTGGIDWVPEVYVGRIPIYDDHVEVLDRILKKTMVYESPGGDRTWRRRALMPAAMLFYDNQYGQKNIRMDGADMADAIFKLSLKPHGLSRTALYEESGVDPSQLKGDLPLTLDNVISTWNNGFGLVTWIGHGSSDGVYRTIWSSDDGDKIPSYKEISSPAFLTYDHLYRLDDRRPAIVFHGSCSNATPEDPDNIAFGLLYNGAVATVGATRVAIMVIGGSVGTSDANIFGVERDFTKSLAQGKTVGEALFEAKGKVSDQVGMLTWYTRLQLPLYGDPAVKLVACTKDAECDDGKACTGLERCQAGQCLSGTAPLCAAADPCTEGRCQEPTGTCAYTARPEGERCDDGLFCTRDDRCRMGTCTGQPRCALADNPCSQATCSESTWVCTVETTGAEGTACRAGTPRAGTCRAGLCEPAASDEGCALASGSRAPSAPETWLLLLLSLLWARRRRRPSGRRASNPR